MKSLNVKSLSGAVLLGLTVLAANPSFAADAARCPTTSLKNVGANQAGMASNTAYNDIQKRVFPW